MLQVLENSAFCPIELALEGASRVGDGVAAGRVQNLLLPFRVF